ncbi:MAG TPA: cytochrome c oxidase assembly protein [Gemmatimonadaceae bacterium]|nr:cytochrome c oxidase assembly protein [Gemmatimonadaceae bacterium]
MNVQWWCSARGIPWKWQWQPYPGVWLAVLALGAAYHRWSRPAASGAHEAASSSARRIGGWIGVALVWMALDWPGGPLGTGYLASVHAAQFLALAMVAPPLLLRGLDLDRVRALIERNGVPAKIIRAVTTPLLSMILFTIVMLGTHAVLVVDTLMRTQLGAFALDLAWFLSGLAFWWPVVIDVPLRTHFGPPMRMLYLFAGTQAHLYLSMWLLLAEYPAYGIYELAPRVTGLSALEDQQVAGGLLLTIGGTYVLAVISVLFFRWFEDPQPER